MMYSLRTLVIPIEDLDISPATNFDASPATDLIVQPLPIDNIYHDALYHDSLPSNTDFPTCFHCQSYTSKYHKKTWASFVN